MKLKRLTEHIWIMPYETERDRPNLGYVKGGSWSLAVDAGHSAAHTKAFYALLAAENLPLPRVTVLTHWHWDHTFGMHAVNGLTLANGRTNGYLKQWREKIAKNGPEEFFALHESIRREYRDNPAVTVKTADMVFAGEMALDLGSCGVRILETAAPHTDDSTVVYVEEDQTLFIGDAAGDDFFTGIKDAGLCAKLAETIRGIRPAICLEGHWEPVSMDNTLEDLMSGI